MCQYRDLCARVCVDGGIRIVPRSLSPFSQLGFAGDLCKSAVRLAQWIRSENIHLVHVNSEACWVGGLAAKLAGVPAVSHLHGLTILSPAWVGWVSVRVLNRLSRALIATSDVVRRAFVSAGAKPEMTHVVCNGVDTCRFDPHHTEPSLRSQLGLASDQPLIGMVANVDPRKGHHVFIDACARVLADNPAARFVIVGSLSLPGTSAYCERLRKQVVERQLTKVFDFLGPRDDIPEVMASLDVVVQPSLTEAGPRAPLEAMAMERPLVVSDAGGNSEEVVDGETGLVVPTQDVVALAEAIIKLTRDRELGCRLGRAGRQHVLRSYRAETSANKIQEIYDRLLSG